ncbi:hypothetical protein [Polaromonas glacialis]|uniref:hypothetical protein n=1 Tax=Polaromonas glacialis TaxID=866564 RepID=UPI000A9E14E8|nr:hypothetical protein [Polaromonas glacialis]
MNISWVLKSRLKCEPFWLRPADTGIGKSQYGIDGEDGPGIPLIFIICKLKMAFAQ